LDLTLAESQIKEDELPHDRPYGTYVKQTVQVSRLCTEWTF